MKKFTVHTVISCVARGTGEYEDCGGPDLR